MIVLVTGDRDWTDRLTMETALSCYRSRIHLLIEGEARGADKMSRRIAEEWGIPFKGYKAKWEIYGKGAGPIRNRQMLDENPNVDLVLAFHPNLNKSKGTRDMVNYALKKGKPVELYDGHTVRRLPEFEGFFRI